VYGRLLASTAVILALLISSFAQQKESDKKPVPPTGGRTTQGQQQTPRPTQSYAPLFLKGKVLLDDGNAPLEPVLVELVCEGSVRLQEHSTVGGDFTVRVGGDAQMGLGDASVGSPGGGTAQYGQQGGQQSGAYRGNEYFSRTPTGGTDLRGCELRTSAPGMQSSAIQLGIRGALTDTDVGVIVLHRVSGSAETTVSLRSLAAPKKAKDAYAKANKELAKERSNPSKAVKELQKAVEIYPEFAAAWELLGEVRLALDDAAGAREAFLEAARVDPEYTAPFLSLAGLELNQGRWEEVIKWSNQALECNPQIVKAQYFVAHANFFMGRLAEAEVAARRVQDSSAAAYYPGTHYMLGTILAEQGDWSSAGGEFNRFLEASPDSSVAGPLRRQLKEWERQGLITSSQSSKAP